MALKKVIAVIGLGRFGLGLVKALATHHVEVVAIDKNDASVADAADLVTNAVNCDSKDPEALKDAGLLATDVAIIAFGQDTQANLSNSILTFMALKKVKEEQDEEKKMKIIVRIDSEAYEELFLTLGADEVISPFDLASRSLATQVASSSIMDYYQVEGDYNVFAFIVPQDVKPIKITTLNTPKNFGINIILYTRDDKTQMPNASYVVQPGDEIYAFGLEMGVHRLQNFLSNQGDE